MSINDREPVIPTVSGSVPDLIPNQEVVRSDAESPNSFVGYVPNEDGPSSCGRRMKKVVNKLSFGVGHVYNDLCAAMWFSYLIIFFQSVLGMSYAHAGVLMTLGQVTDGLATPVVGLLVDRVPLPLRLLKFGRRKVWHALGTALVTLSFPLVFNACLFDRGYVFDIHTTIPEGWKVVYYAIPIMIFQIGWASVQISHLSMIPELARCESERTALNSLRYLFTMAANMSTYLMLYFLLNRTGEDEKAKLGPQDMVDFTDSGYIILCIGLFFSAAFYFGTPSPRDASFMTRTLSYERTVSTSGEVVAMAWHDWFRHVQFYQVAVLYTLSRMFVNVSQMFFPLYISFTRKMDKQWLAVMPLIVFLSSFCVSNLTSLKVVNRRLNRKLSYICGCLIGIATSVYYFYDSYEWPFYPFIVATVCNGVANSLVAVGALSITADLIRKDTESGAFVYGCMSFADKVANGLAASVIQLLLQHLHADGGKCDPTTPDTKCQRFYRSVQVFVPAGCLLAALAVMATLWRSRIGHRPVQTAGGPNDAFDHGDEVDGDKRHGDHADPESTSSGTDNYETPTSSVHTTPQRA